MKPLGTQLLTVPLHVSVQLMVLLQATVQLSPSRFFSVTRVHQPHLAPVLGQCKGRLCVRTPPAPAQTYSPAFSMRRLMVDQEQLQAAAKQPGRPHVLPV